MKIKKKNVKIAPADIVLIDGEEAQRWAVAGLACLRYLSTHGRKVEAVLVVVNNERTRTVIASSLNSTGEHVQDAGLQARCQTEFMR